MCGALPHLMLAVDVEVEQGFLFYITLPSPIGPEIVKICHPSPRV